MCGSECWRRLQSSCAELSAVMKGTSSRTQQARCPCAGSVFVEQRPTSAPLDDCAPAEPFVFSSRPDQEMQLPAPEQGACAWGLYSCAEAVDGLMAYLNVQGRREAALKRVRLNAIL